MSDSYKIPERGSQDFIANFISQVPQGIREKFPASVEFLSGIGEKQRNDMEKHYAQVDMVSQFEQDLLSADLDTIEGIDSIIGADNDFSLKYHALCFSSSPRTGGEHLKKDPGVMPNIKGLAELVDHLLEICKKQLINSRNKLAESELDIMDPNRGYLRSSMVNMAKMYSSLTHWNNPSAVRNHFHAPGPINQVVNIISSLMIDEKSNYRHQIAASDIESVLKNIKNEETRRREKLSRLLSSYSGDDIKNIMTSLGYDVSKNQEAKNSTPKPR